MNILIFFLVVQGPRGFCGLGGIIYLSNEDSIDYSVGLGLGTNNYMDISSLWLILRLAKEYGIIKLKNYGDSHVAVNWMRKEIFCHNMF